VPSTPPVEPPRSHERLLFAPLGTLYAQLVPIAIVLMRIAAGVALVMHGSGKIADPFRQVGMVESLGFHPGVFWSPLLAGTEFFGGILLAIGLLTRPAALSGMIVLLVTVWFHWVVRGEGYPGAEKSLLWAAICLYFVAHGGSYLAVDRWLPRQV
jgi:putative oxidoreductase